MPGEPKRRHSKMRKRTRRAAIKLVETGLVKCSNCQGLTIPHQVCKNCGYYKGIKVKDKSTVKVIKA